MLVFTPRDQKRACIARICTRARLELLQNTVDTARAAIPPQKAQRALPQRPARLLTLLQQRRPQRCSTPYHRNRRARTE
jgi:hypothetical protein